MHLVLFWLKHTFHLTAFAYQHKTALKRQDLFRVFLKYPKIYQLSFQNPSAYLRCVLQMFLQAFSFLNAKHFLNHLFEEYGRISLLREIYISLRTIIQKDLPQFFFQYLKAHLLFSLHCLQLEGHLQLELLLLLELLGVKILRPGPVIRAGADAGLLGHRT